MSLITYAQNKDAINFKKAINERIQEKVDASLAESKVIVAGTLLGEAKTKLPHVSKMPTPKPGKAKLPSKSVKEGVETYTFDGEGTSAALDEKVITPGSVEHMAHAVHAAANGELEPTSSRGTFSTFHHPHYIIHKDHGSINPDKAEHNYYVAGAGGMHKFSVEHTKHGVDVKHHGVAG